MAEIKVHIRFNDNYVTSLSSLFSNKLTNNVSIRSRVIDLGIDEGTKLPITTENDGKNGICIGSWSVGDVGLLSTEKDSYGGYMFGINDTVTISITGENTVNVTFDFDKLANQYPTEILVNDDGGINNYENNELSFNASFSFGDGVKEVTFKNWVRSDYNACISNIKIPPNNYTLTKRHIISVLSKSQSSTLNSYLPYGVLANSGSLQTVDNNGVLKTFGEKGFFSSNYFDMDFEVNGKTVQHHTVRDSNYKTDKSFSFNCTNDISDYSQKRYTKRTYASNTLSLFDYLADILIDTNVISNKSELYEFCDTTIKIDGKNKIIESISTSSSEEFETEFTVSQYLNSIIIPTPFTRKEDNLKNGIQNVCDVAQLCCYKDFNGRLKFVNGRPLATNEEIMNYLKLNEKSHISSPNYSEISTNWYNEAYIKGGE